MIPEVLSGVLDDAVADAAVAVVDASGPGRVRIDGVELVNLASCDYLGFARDPRVVGAARAALEEWGVGTASTRTLAGTTAAHRRLEAWLAAWVGTADAVLHGSCWTANAAVFGGLAALAGRAGTTLHVASDRLNHASIIDAIRAQHRVVSRLDLFDHGDLLEDGVPRGLEASLAAAEPGAVRVIVTDGVFSMEGDQAPLRALVALAERHDAVLVVDDSHGVGVAGATGRGCGEDQGVSGRIDVITGTLGKALGGGLGGFVATGRALAAALRRESRPYVFSNNPPVPVVAGALAALDVLAGPESPLPVLRHRTARLRRGVDALGLPTVTGEHPIVPIIIGEEAAARSVGVALRRNGVFATALAFPIVPRGEARLRLQVSAAHSPADVDLVLDALSRSLPGSRTR